MWTRQVSVRRHIMRYNVSVVSGGFQKATGKGKFARPTADVPV